MKVTRKSFGIFAHILIFSRPCFAFFPDHLAACIMKMELVVFKNAWLWLVQVALIRPRSLRPPLLITGFRELW